MLKDMRLQKLWQNTYF